MVLTYLVSLFIGSSGGGGDVGSSGGISGSGSNSGVRVTASEDPAITPPQYRDSHQAASSSIARKSSSPETRLIVSDDGDADDGENKYKRRSAVEWFGRWWR